AAKTSNNMAGLVSGLMGPKKSGCTLLRNVGVSRRAPHPFIQLEVSKPQPPSPTVCRDPSSVHCLVERTHRDVQVTSGSRAGDPVDALRIRALGPLDWRRTLLGSRSRRVSCVWYPGALPSARAKPLGP